MNNISIVGRLGADPVLKYTPSGVAVTELRVAVNRDFKNAQGEREADWFNVTAWRQTAEYCANFLAKGRLVAVTGRMQRRQYDKDGAKVTVWDLMANTVNGIDKAPEGSERASSDDGGAGAADYSDPFQDE